MIAKLVDTGAELYIGDRCTLITAMRSSRSHVGGVLIHMTMGRNGQPRAGDLIVIS